MAINDNARQLADIDAAVIMQEQDLTMSWQRKSPACCVPRKALRPTNARTIACPDARKNVQAH